MVSMRRRLGDDWSSPAGNHNVRTGTLAAPDAANRAASHAPRAVVASTSKPSALDREASRCVIRADSTTLRVEKLTANEDDGTWRDMVVLSGSCVGNHRRRRAGRLSPESSTASLRAQTSIGLPAYA